ncbi:L-threonylcarbamoyladenylate synthase [uncultured Sphingomonas sp.]|uniref:L-threonylcarbamoyladenylate synthase n=1 Tax=uncultured Sphingomonas sp. TaxID=158754 RepID=UPI0035CBEDBE
MPAPDPTPPPVILGYSDAAIAEAARMIGSGGIVAVPTETVYGLAADATDGAAVARIYAAKGRPRFNPLIVHFPTQAAAEALAGFDDDARALAAAFWPGPLTLVLPLRPGAAVAALVTAGLTTVAIRVPDHRAMRGLLAATGKPLAAPSANRSGGISPTRAEHVAASLGSAVPLILDDGPTRAGLESTIVQGRTILRPGPITAEQLEAVLSPTRLPDSGGSSAPPRTPDRPTAPGQLLSHYAPTKPLRLDATDAAADEWLIGFGPVTGDDDLSSAGDLIQAAARLFDALHRADASARPRIAVAPVPHTGIGEAINDRLRRAAHP